MKEILISFLKIIVGLYIVLCGLLYLFQEKLIFFPQKLERNYPFNFDQKFQELDFKTSDGKTLNGLLFESKNAKGLIFYLPGFFLPKHCDNRNYKK